MSASSHHLESLGRKRSTLGRVRVLSSGCTSRRSSASALWIGSEPRDVEAFIAAKRREGKATKSILNYLGLLHSIFALRREARAGRRATRCKLVDKPRAERRRPRHPLPRRGRARGAARAPCRDDVRGSDRARALPDRRDDRPAPGRAARPALARHRLAGRPASASASSYVARRVRHAEVPAVVAVGAAGRPRGRRARAPLPAQSPSRPTTTSSSATRETGGPLDRSRAAASASRRRAKRAGVRRGPLPRPAPHLRHPDGGGRASPLRTLQEWMGHRDFKTTLIYADYQPSAGEAELVERAFGQGAKRGAKLSKSAADLS